MRKGPRQEKTAARPHKKIEKSNGLRTIQARGKQKKERKARTKPPKDSNHLKGKR